MSRESRLLILTIAVSAIVLLLLAQFRFPEAPPPVAPTAPLERLAARASFEELATRVAQLESTIAPDLMVLRLAPRADPPGRQLADVLTQPGRPLTEVDHVPALRIDPTTGVAAIPPTARISGIVRPAGVSGTAGIAALDPVRGLARVRVPDGPARSVPQRALANLRTPAYVVAVEGTQAGLTLRPVFLGRSDRFQSPRWTRPLLPLGGIVVTPGALMFTLDGEFLGIVVVEHGTLAIASGTEAIDTVRTLDTSPPAPVDPGLAVQPLTSPLAAALGVSRGVVVTEVIDDSPADAALEPGDVIVEVDGQPIDTPEALLLRLSTRLARSAVAVTIIRGGEVQTLELRRRETDTPAPADDLALQTVRGAGTRVTAVPALSSLGAAGLRAGDVIVRAGDASTPTAAQVRGVLAAAEPGSFVLLTVRRNGRQHLVTLQQPASPDAAGR